SDFLFAAWQVLLYRFTGQSPVVVGCLVDGRKYEELDAMLGLTARYLPVACPMVGNLSFREVLKQSTVEKKNVYQYQEGFPDVYDSSYVGKISESYRILIEAASQLPDVALAEIPLLNEPKFLRWLEQINSPQKSLADITFVHDVIAQVAQKQPNEIAMEGES